MTNPTAYFFHQNSADLDKAKHYEAALASCRRALATDPKNREIKLTLATMLINWGQFSEAEALMTQVQADTAPWWDARGVMHSYQGRYDEAIAAFYRAAELDPAGNPKRIGLAGTYLLKGDWPSGFEFQRRYLEAVPSSGSRWEGQEVNHLTIHYDLGMGDIINMARFIPWAASRAKKTTIIFPRKLAWLMQEYDKYGELRFDINLDYQPEAIANIHSLPRLYGCQPDNIPADPGLLSWGNITSSLPADAFKIGIVWAGNPNFPGDRWRSMDLENLLPLAEHPGVQLYGLQVGNRAGDINKIGASTLIHDLSGQIELNYAFAAGAIQAMDLIVTVDTAMAHIAGALGKPTFMAIPVFPDWRWGTSGSSTPWYPSMTIFRQKVWGDWSHPISEIKNAILELLHERQISRNASLGNVAAE